MSSRETEDFEARPPETEPIKRVEAQKLGGETVKFSRRPDSEIRPRDEFWDELVKPDTEDPFADSHWNNHIGA